MQAKNNIKIVMRQTFYWGNYSIIGDDMLPNPVGMLSFVMSIAAIAGSSEWDPVEHSIN